MLFRERPREAAPRPNRSPTGGPGNPGGNLEATRRRGDNLLAAGDTAINRALSGDSQAFLAATRQHGGQ